MTEEGIAAEYRELWLELPAAHAKAASLLRTDPPNHRLEGEALRRFLEADAEAGFIVRRIKEIHALGPYIIDDGKPNPRK